MNSIGMYKNPYFDMYVAPRNYAFYKNDRYLGRIIWEKNIDGIYIDKDKFDNYEDNDC